MRTKQCFVNSIDDALDPDNYDTMELPTPKKQRTWTLKLGPEKKKDVETIGWTDQLLHLKVANNGVTSLPESRDCGALMHGTLK